jgi:uncharacterized membrane protein
MKIKELQKVPASIRLILDYDMCTIIGLLLFAISLWWVAINITFLNTTDLEN